MNSWKSIKDGNIFDILLLSYFCVFAFLFFSESNIFILALPIFFYIWKRFIQNSEFKKLKASFSLGLTFFLIFILSSYGRNVIAEYYIDKSTHAFFQNEIKTSIDYFQKAKRFSPDHPEILFLQYESAKAAGDDKKAYEFLEKAVYAGYENIDAWYDLARLHNKYGNRKKEVRLYEKVLKVSPEHPEANYGLAMYYDEVMHNRKKAIQHLKIARDNLPEGNVWRKRCEEILEDLESKT